MFGRDLLCCYGETVLGETREYQHGLDSYGAVL